MTGERAAPMQSRKRDRGMGFAQKMHVAEDPSMLPVFNGRRRLRDRFQVGRRISRSRLPLLAKEARSGAPHSWGTLIFQQLFADAELSNDGFVALGIVSLEVVEQATPLADQHKQAAARAVVLLVRFEVVCELADAFTDDGDLNLGTSRVSRVRLVPVNDRLLLLSG